ncbi:MAG: hypothetical protein M0Z50_19205, partial [Planctomycetia bacterium]|nr:hypothetical protein [Planctomycetia bacterium]
MGGYFCLTPLGPRSMVTSPQEALTAPKSPNATPANNNQAHKSVALAPSGCNFIVGLILFCPLTVGSRPHHLDHCLPGELRAFTKRRGVGEH